VGAAGCTGLLLWLKLLLLLLLLRLRRGKLVKAALEGSDLATKGGILSGEVGATRGGCCCRCRRCCCPTSVPKRRPAETE
jgi:hypothetical protein